jgi:hypothetical protein
MHQSIRKSLNRQFQLSVLRIVSNNVDKCHRTCFSLRTDEFYKLRLLRIRFRYPIFRDNAAQTSLDSALEHDMLTYENFKGANIISLDIVFGNSSCYRK